MAAPDYFAVLRFWFDELKPQQHFIKDEKLDCIIRERFFETYQFVLSGKSEIWRSTPEGRLAEIIVLDQFSRNLFRGRPESFSGDALAQHLAREAVRAGADQELELTQRSFIYMPLMHSENLSDHALAAKLFSQKGLEPYLHYEILHKEIIERFGRYPHRNQVLGRTSTPEEFMFLKENPGF